MTDSTPKVIRRSDPSQLVIEWTDGNTSTISAARLRGYCPCAQCVHELTGERMIDPARVPADTTQHDLALVGHYAVSMRFSDGHHTGIYTFPYLRKLGEAQPG
ncbi:MAG: DUF971 domain-containing protein [Planctomycetia bacterium]